MTQKLEQLFDLDTQPTEEEFIEGVKALDEIEQQLPVSSSITDLSTSDQEMDDLATKAVKHYDDLMDLGMNVEPRFSAPIFDAASKLLGHAITAKTSKIDKKLKALDLDIKRRRLEMQEKQANLTDDDETGSARELDRNSLLEILRNKDNNS
jgi:alcohol dehydrogenase YqhD (iron-dependent ADH family)